MTALRHKLTSWPRFVGQRPLRREGRYNVANERSLLQRIGGLSDTGGPCRHLDLVRCLPDQRERRPEDRAGERAAAVLAGKLIWIAYLKIEGDGRRLVNVGFEPANKIGHKRTHAPR